MSKTKDIIQSEALVAVGNKHRAGVAASMGVGKTKIGLTHMNSHYTDYNLFLVVAPKVSVFTTWKEEAVQHGLAHLVEYIEFSTYVSLHKKDLSKYGGIYLDEMHNLLDSHDAVLSEFKGFILGLTGTAPKHESSEKGRMVAKYCPVVYKYSVDDAVEDGILNDYEIIVHHMPLCSEKNLLMKKGGKQWFSSEKSVYDYWCSRIQNANSQKELQITRIMRMKAMMEFSTKDRYARKLVTQITDKVLLFANTQKQADSFGILSTHSDNLQGEENLLKFKAGKTMKLACVLQLSEGINIPELKQLILMHSYGNERKASQRIGRGLRLNPNDKATVHILCFDGTVDEDWIESALSDFDEMKIKHIYDN